MNPDLIDRVDWSGTEYTELQLSGEPLLHPKLLEIIQRIKKKGIKVGFSTNAFYIKRLIKLIGYVDSVTVNEDEFRKIPKALLNCINVNIQRLGKNFPIEDYSHTKKVKTYPDCITPFRYAVIQWDGDIVPCCKAHGKTTVFGNLYESEFHAIMNSQIRIDFLWSIKHKLDNDLCEYCQYANPHMIHKKIRESL